MGTSLQYPDGLRLITVYSLGPYEYLAPWVVKIRLKIYLHVGVTALPMGTCSIGADTAAIGALKQTVLSPLSNTGAHNRHNEGCHLYSWPQKIVGNQRTL